MASTFSNDEINEFKVEALELLDLGEKGLLALDNQGNYKGHFDAIFRAFHSIKGAAGMMELMDLQAHMHQLESLLIGAKDLSNLPKNLADLFLRGIDAARLILEGQNVNFDYSVADADNGPTDDKSQKLETMQDLRESSSQDFFAECEDIIQRLAANFENIAQQGSTPQLIDAIYRDIHSLKGGAFLMGFNQIGEFTHGVESCLDYLRESKTTPSAGLIDVLFKSNDLIERMLKDCQQKTNLNFTDEMAEMLPKISSELVSTPVLTPLPKKESPPMKAPTSTPSAATPSPNPPEAKSDSELANSTVRVPVGLLDKLMTLVGEMVLVRNQVIQYSNKSDNFEFLNLSQRLNVVTSEIQGEMMKTRMQPIGNILSKFQRVVRDLSRDLNKKIDLFIEGNETELDKTLLEAIKDPLTHIVRNSCDHGVETPEVRRSAGKPEHGTIRIRAYHEGGQVVVEIADDGKGLHREKLIAKAIEKNLITKEKAAAMSDRDAMNLIFAPGFSTAAQITNVSGRGVGMDVVKSNIDRIGGAVELESTAQKGTTIRLKIPLTLAIVPAMIIRCGEDRYAIPQVKLAELVRVEAGASEEKIEYLQGQPVFRLRGRLLPLLDLKGVLKFDNHHSRQAIEKAEAINIIVLNSDRHQFGLIVDEIQDTADIVVKPLSRFLKSLAVYSGATVLGDGSVALILDVAGIAETNLALNETLSAISAEETKANDRPLVRDEQQEFLLFRLNSPTKHAVFLGYVNRLEEFKRNQIEVSGSQRVVRYRDAILPIYSLNQSLNYPLSDEAQVSDVVSVIVTQKGTHLYGIEVNEILDVFETSASIDHTVSDRPGLMGNVVTENEVVVIVDPHHCLPHERNLKVVAPSKANASTPVHGYGLPSSKRLLFAEDTAFFRKHVSGVLTRAGYEVTLAKDGEEALAMLERKGADYFSAILSDIEMPKMNGFELAARLRQDSRYSQAIVVALTTKSAPKDRERGLKAGFTAYLEKLNAEELLTTLEALTTRHSEEIPLAEERTAA